jgi:alkylation response protein AidB-like acyl-CoA dehydrogenase
VIEGEDLELFERSLRHAVERRSGAGLDAALTEVGWHELLEIDERAAVSLLFELQGRSGATSSALDAVLALALGKEAGAVVLPALGQWRAPGALVGDRLAVRGLGTSGLASREMAWVIAGSGEQHVALAIETAALELQASPGIDPWLGAIEVTGEILGAAPAGPADWRAAVAAGQRALAHELVSASRRMLELACEHALARVQFGQPIARFQAIRHRLAETLIAIEMADAALAAAWLDRSPQMASMAKATAGLSARTAARHCQQVLAGIGFMTEHDLHRGVRRVLVLEQLLGATRLLTRELGSEILAQQRLPVPLPL